MFADADAAGADEDLSGDEVRGHEACHQVERYRPQHHVVFVRAPAGSFAVDVVAVQHDFPSRRLACLGCGGAHDEIAGTVVSHRFEGVGCFRRGVFGMRVVDVDTTPVRAITLVMLSCGASVSRSGWAAARSSLVPRASLTGSSCR